MAPSLIKEVKHEKAIRDHSDICHAVHYGAALGAEYGCRGDVNEDGKINIRDVAAIQRYLANFGTLTLAQLMAADTDGDGSVTVDDATWLQMYLAEYDVVLGKQS